MKFIRLDIKKFFINKILRFYWFLQLKYKTAVSAFSWKIIFLFIGNKKNHDTSLLEEIYKHRVIAVEYQKC